VVPAVSTLIGAIWGLGFSGLLGYNLEPLTLVIPLLIAARALSHSVQITERYFECYEESHEVKTACVECASSILPPGALGITTDAIGILLIAVAPIPMMQKLAYICGFWAFMIAFTGLILTPVVISFFKPPKNIPDIVDMSKGITQKVLGQIAGLGYGKAGVTTVIGAVLVFAATGWIASKVDIGDVHPGSPVLWPDSEFNAAVGEISKSFPGTEELYVIVEGSDKGAIEDPVFLSLLASFQQHLERCPEVAATLSIRDFLPHINRGVFGGYFKWGTIPFDEVRVGALFHILMGNAAAGDFDLYFSRVKKEANVIVWFKDHMGETIRSAISSVKTFIKEHKDELAKANAKIHLASGNIGVLAAINETVQEAQFLNFILVMAVIFILCSITYRSIVAAVILMIPLNLANLITLSIMKWLGIGLNINTLPIISVGVGVGIDYGIYLLSRLCEEYQARGEYSLSTANRAVRTTGKAIFFTATTMIGGVIFWYFLSSLRFQAEMGLMLAIIMFVNMLGALLLVPSLVYVVKPKFLGRVKLLVR
jgi:predicted RND superfamily exporter protein